MCVCVCMSMWIKATSTKLQFFSVLRHQCNNCRNFKCAWIKILWDQGICTEWCGRSFSMPLRITAAPLLHTYMSLPLTNWTNITTSVRASLHVCHLEYFWENLHWRRKYCFNFWIHLISKPEIFEMDKTGLKNFLMYPFIHYVTHIFIRRSVKSATPVNCVLWLLKYNTL